jgi:hypothetical protein
MGQMGQERGTGEIKNTHTISVENFEIKKHFRRSRSRGNVKNVMNWT